MVSVVLLALWNVIYFVFIYKKDKFFAGMGDIPTNVYTQQNKKNFLFTMLAETVVMMVFFGYFLCVTATYSEDMHGPEQPEEETPAEEEKPKSEAPKEDEAPKEEAAAEGDAPAENAEAPAEGAAAE